MLRIEIAGAKPFVSFAYPGSLPGHTFGLTGAGLVNVVNNVRVIGASVGVPRMVLGRAVLDAPTIDRAIALLREAPRAGGFHLTLGQRGDRRIVSIEFLHAAISVVEVTRRSVHANHIIHPALAETAQIVTKSSASRQCRGDALVEAGAEPRSLKGAVKNPVCVSITSSASARSHLAKGQPP
jgi:acyl-CoA:6-aminopenicillanic acid acyl transferase